MDISVIISTWNRCDSLERLLTNFVRIYGNSKLDWELIVVDNNSTDRTQDVLSGFVGRLPLRIHFEPRQGKSVACNSALQHAHGDVLLWTDDDVIPVQGWLEANLSRFNAGDADVVFGKVVPESENL